MVFAVSMRNTSERLVAQCGGLDLIKEVKNVKNRSNTQLVLWDTIDIQLLNADIGVIIFVQRGWINKQIHYILADLQMAVGDLISLLINKSRHQNNSDVRMTASK